MEQRVKEIETECKLLHMEMAEIYRRMTAFRQDIAATNEFLVKLKLFVDETLEDRDGLLRQEIEERDRELFKHVSETFKILQSLENEND